MMEQMTDMELFHSGVIVVLAYQFLARISRDHLQSCDMDMPS